MSDTRDVAEFERRVRERAYALWESEGRPHGKDFEHWRRSVEELLAELPPAAAEEPVAEPEPAAAESKVEPAPVQPAAKPTVEPAPAPVKGSDKPKAGQSKKKAGAKTAAPARGQSATLQ
jgi:hypothetical protein